MSAAERSGAGDSALARLAARYGIEPGFRDARGDQIVTNAGTQTALLRTMGVEAGTEGEASAALRDMERAEGASVLPPVLVVRPRDGRCSIAVNLPRRVRQIAWRVQLEDGSERSGMADCGEAGAGSTLAGGSAYQLDLADLPWGYHRLHLQDLEASTQLIVTPGQCWLPDGFTEGPGLWGIAVQLYLLRSERNWGIGDFGDLRALVELAAPRGCDVIGLNPLHQMFLDNPEHASPYSPLTRLYLNALYIAVPDVPGYADSAAMREVIGSEAFKARLEEARAASHVNYSAVVSVKVEALRILFREFGANGTESRKRGFEAFRREQGQSLERAAIFQLLRQHFAAQDSSLADWHNWPDEYRNASSQGVHRFAEEHRADVDFLVWLQWLADEQLGAAARAATDAGMAIRLYRDLAVGSDRAGAETWANPDAFLAGAVVGAPPDIFNPAGQNWGLPPFHPNALREEGYRSFIELIRANMRHAGGLRIDHVMGLQHLYCIPDGEDPAGGAYVGYPIDDLVGVLALESQRHSCLVVGEDLGTVPEGFRERMAAANILSYRVLFFEQDWGTGTFLPPERYPRLALAVTGSHDLPTLRGWWESRDISLREELRLYPSDDEARSQRGRRETDRKALLQALRQEGLIPLEGELTAEAFALGAHAFLARTGAALVVPQLDDMLDEADPVNVPATFLEYPNWRRKYRTTLEEIAASDEPWARLGEISTRRGSAGKARNAV